MHSHKKMIPIWFFIGVLLTAYGVLITGAGIYELWYPPEKPVVLAGLHVGIWWGLVCLGMGVLYTLKYRPGRDEDNT